MLLFTINVVPEAQKQTRFSFKHGIHSYNPSQKYIDYCKWQIKAFAPAVPLEGPIDLTMYFFLTIPKSTSGVQKRQMINGKIMHMKKPDLDNLAYAITNAMKGIIYGDDSQVVKMCMQKMYAENPRIVVKVRNLNDEIFNINEMCC